MDLYIAIIIIILLLAIGIFLFSNTTKGTALIIINPQYDFSYGGSLSIPDSDSIFPEINKLRETHNFDKTVIVKEWHPENHISFASQHKLDQFTNKKIYIEPITKYDDKIGYIQELLPDHCIEYTRGAEIHHKLIMKPSDYVIKIGTAEEIDSYSGFGDKFNNKFEQTELDWYLKTYGKECDHIVICGLGTDSCVEATALDAINRKYNVTIINSTIRGLRYDSTCIAIERMKNRGVVFIDSVEQFKMN